MSRTREAITEEALTVPWPLVTPGMPLVAALIEEELVEREWTIRTLAECMGGDVEVNYLTLRLILYLPDDPRGRLGRETAAQLALAFGTSVEFFLRLAGEA